jgi:hypothetical protein
VATEMAAPQEGVSATQYQAWAWELWKLYVATTMRGDTQPPEGVIKKLVKGLAKHQRLSRTRLRVFADYASLLHPVEGDTGDTKRLIDVVQYKTTFTKAKKLSQTGAIPVMWMKLGSENARERLLGELGVPNSVELGDDDLRALYTLETLSDERLCEVVDKAKNHLGHSWLMPQDAIDYGLKTPREKHHKKAATAEDKAYASGEHESVSYASTESLPLDTAAKRLIANGADTNTVLTFHLNVPEGYWDAVGERILMNGRGLNPESLKEVYGELETTWNFHPNNRMNPHA